MSRIRPSVSIVRRVRVPYRSTRPPGSAALSGGPTCRDPVGSPGTKTDGLWSRSGSPCRTPRAGLTGQPVSAAPALAGRGRAQDGALVGSGSGRWRSSRAASASRRVSASACRSSRLETRRRAHRRRARRVRRGPPPGQWTRKGPGRAGCAPGRQGGCRCSRGSRAPAGAGRRCRRPWRRSRLMRSRVRMSPVNW